MSVQINSLIVVLSLFEVSAYSVQLRDAACFNVNIWVI
jgi:hypothetical protein